MGAVVLKPGQAVLISGMEHHSNIVPWQLLRDAHGIELRVAPVTDAGELDMAAFEALLQDGKVGLVAITHMSNVLGTVVPAERSGSNRPCAWRQGAVRPAPRRLCTARWMSARWIATSMPGPDTSFTGPTGIGVLWARRELLDRMPPFLGGGEMISSVSYEHTTWAEVPHKFEAGTPAILEGHRPESGDRLRAGDRLRPRWRRTRRR